jgi:hypothetical protein
VVRGGSQASRADHPATALGRWARATQQALRVHAEEVASAMVTGHIHRVLVTRAKKMVGIISSMDLLELVRDM